jgi:signal transduction histidine kinase
MRVRRVVCAGSDSPSDRGWIFGRREVRLRSDATGARQGYRPDVSRGIRRVAGSAWADAALAAGLFALAQVELWDGVTYQGGPVFPGSRWLTALIVIPLMTLPLALRRRAPLISFATVMTTIAWSSLAFGGAEATSFFLVALVCVYSAAANGVRAPLVLVIAAAVISVHELRDSHVHGIGDLVWAFGFVVLGAMFGIAVRGRHHRIHSLERETERLEAAREQEARAAVAAERARVARELHDVVAHAVSVVVVQSQAGQRLVGVDDAGARQSLEAIEETARAALNEMRRLLGMLRGTEDVSLAPQPGLAAIDSLVAHVRDAGLPVSVDVVGEPVRLPPGAELSAYRVVQEGLTNALKHARATRVSVRIRYRGSDVEIEIEDDGIGGEASGDGGHGLLGMRERVALYGGDLEGGRRPEGGWFLRARLPLEA